MKFKTFESEQEKFFGTLNEVFRMIFFVVSVGLMMLGFLFFLIWVLGVSNKNSLVVSIFLLFLAVIYYLRKKED